EAGARAGMVAVDDTTIEYLADRPYSPKGEYWDQAVAYWRGLVSDPEATFDREVSLDAAEILPQVTWGTSPEMVVSIDGSVPDPDDMQGPAREGALRALEYMGLKPGTRITDIQPDKV